MKRKTDDFQHVTRWLEKISGEHSPRPYIRNYHKYQAILIACLPSQWASRVMLGKVDSERWQLYVQHSHEAYQLHYLLPEIRAELAQKLTFVPHLRINANPRLWLDFPARRKPIRVADGKSYSIEEAEAIINRFLANGE